MNIVDSTASYERWLAEQIPLNPLHLSHKHAHMAEAAFPFMRATFYRFMQLWEIHAQELDSAPAVLAVGDVHVENFGTWRDTEGRLIWGLNDFDEVYPLPYTLDLVRLALSAHLAAQDREMAIAREDACDAILSGYRDGMAEGGQPFVLAENHKWLRDTVTGDLRDPVRFWGKIDLLDQLPADVPKPALRALERLLPVGAEVDRIVLREAGLGSLGRPRFVLLAHLFGSRLARETKALCRSACVWAGRTGGDTKTMYADALAIAVRASDPFVDVRRNWLVRRLAPYCSHVELAALPRQHDQLRLLRAMGYELANMHLGTSGAAKRILKDLKRRPRHWLHRSSEALLEATLRDFEDWRTHCHAPDPAATPPNPGPLKRHSSA